MTTIFIRFKSLLTFGLVLLSVSFVWFTITSFNQEEKTKSEETGSSLTAIEPTITIVPEETIEKESFFSEYRLERDRTRSEQIEVLNEIINNANSSTEVRADAQQKLLLLTENLGKETKIETAIIAKGFTEAVAVMQAQSVLVIVPSKGLRQDEIAKIADIVTKIAECRWEDVIIVPKTE
jgi:stage III sporulation protein AH